VGILQSLDAITLPTTWRAQLMYMSNHAYICCINVFVTLQVKGAEKVLFGLNDIAGAAEIIIVEGEMDKLALEEAGFRNVVRSQAPIHDSLVLIHSAASH